MPFIDKAVLGKISSDIQLKQAKNGEQFCTFSLSNIEGWGDKKKKMFLKCIAWGNKANVIQRNFKRGDMILFSYDYDDQPWQKNEKGYNIPNPVFTVDQIHFLPRANSDESNDSVDIPASMQMSGVNGENDDFAIIDGEDGDLPF